VSKTIIVDVGTGNLHSVQKAIEHVTERETVRVTNDPDVVARADRVILPGQGAIGSCMKSLDSEGLREVVLEAAASKPFLGICLGLQVLYGASDEDGGTAALGALDGHVRGFAAQAEAGHMNDPLTGHPFKIPHMGWNQVNQRNQHPLWRDIDQDTRFYFVHSYYVDSAQAADMAGATEYGITFTSAAARDNIFAVQFHPEKSQHAGLTLLRNFVNWDGSAP
jgi:glutamine amidotransferase